MKCKPHQIVHLSQPIPLHSFCAARPRCLSNLCLFCPQIVSDDPNQPVVRLGGKLGTFSQTIRGTILHVYFVSPFLGVSAPFKAVINRGKPAY